VELLELASPLVEPVLLLLKEPVPPPELGLPPESAPPPDVDPELLELDGGNC